MKKIQFIIGLIALSVAYSSSIKPVDAQSFWHQLKDQALNRHGWQYGYGNYPARRTYRGYGGGGYYGGQNPWGTYGNQQGWGHQQLEQHQLQEHQQMEQHQQY